MFKRWSKQRFGKGITWRHHVLIYLVNTLQVNSKGLPAEQLQKELSAVNEYYDRQQAHLTLRVTKSLKLLKTTIPENARAAKPRPSSKNNAKYVQNPKENSFFKIIYFYLILLKEFELRGNVGETQTDPPTCRYNLCPYSGYLSIYSVRTNGPWTLYSWVLLITRVWA